MTEQIKVSEVSSILRQQLEGIHTSIKLEEVGTVLQVSDGVARIYGLDNAEANELLQFDNGMEAIVMNLEEDNVGAVLLGPTDRIKEGDTVKRTGRIASIDVSEGMIGRVIDPLGNPVKPHWLSIPSSTNVATTRQGTRFTVFTWRSGKRVPR